MGTCHSITHLRWSSDPSISMCYDGGIWRGVWAGDRFDITTPDVLEKEDENEQQVAWKDVSDEVMKEMAAIWKSEYA